MHIRIEGHDLPGIGWRPGSGMAYGNIHVGVQGRSNGDDVLGLTPGDAPAATWLLECTVTPGATDYDVKGPHIQGRPGARFIYLLWGNLDQAGVLNMFRRAKLQLDAVPPDVLREALARGVLVGRVGLTDRKGTPLCASVRPPLIEWFADMPYSGG